MSVIAKKSINFNFTNAELEINENNEYILTETTKDDIKIFNLSTLLDSLVGYNNVSITIKTVNELEADYEEESYD